MLKKVVQSGLFWALVPVGILGASVAGMTTMVILGSNDPSFSVEPDYYKKAVLWDDHMAQEAQNDALGWKLDFRASSAKKELSLELEDADGQAIDGAEISVEAFHNARANRVLTATLSDRGSGLYEVAIPRMERPGIWEFRFQVRASGHLFTHIAQKEI